MKVITDKERESQLSEIQNISRKFSENMDKFRAYDRYPLKRVREILKMQRDCLFFVLCGLCQSKEIEELNILVENLLKK